MTENDFQELMAILSIPRPNGNAAERWTSQTLQRWLQKRSIPYQIQPFRQYPYLFEATGIWLILSRTLLALAILLRWNWWSLPIALRGFSAAPWMLPCICPWYPGLGCGAQKIL